MNKPILSWALITIGGVFLATASCKGAIEDSLGSAAAEQYKALGSDYDNVKFSPDGLNFTLTGEVPNEEVRTNAGNVASNDVFPWGADAVDNQLTVKKPAPAVVPPRHYNIMLKYNAGVSIDGEVPSLEVQNALKKSVETAFGPDVTVTDNTTIVEGVPYPNLSAAMTSIPTSIVQFETASGSLTDGKINIVGTAANTRAKKSIETSYAAVEGYPHTMSVSVNEAFAALDKCQTAFDELLGKNKIEFKTGSAVISKGSYQLLGQLAELAQTCPKAEIEIAGHTDSRGSDKSNQRLSESRAKSVVKFLDKKGVNKGVTYFGYGETKPKATNETDIGRSQNRRIEFTIKGVK